MNYRMPAEWEPHEATLISWPHQKADWPNRFTPIPWVYAEIVRILSRFERVDILLNDESMESRVLEMLIRVDADLDNVALIPTVNDRSWVRDSGPIVVRDETGQRVALDWFFNAWAKYDNWRSDDRIPRIYAEHRGLPIVQPMRENRRIVLEGGSIDVNGNGLLLTTEECLLSTTQERNPGFTRGEYETAFRQYLGIETIVWLGQGIIGDDTHGHVDDISRFVNETTVVTAIEPNDTDPNHEPLLENRRRLEAHGLTTVALPMPEPVFHRDIRLPASYANFYIANDVVLVPTFNDVNDRLALGILAELFPTRKVVGIHAVELVWGLGTLHCLTQQIPIA